MGTAIKKGLAAPRYGKPNTERTSNAAVASSQYRGPQTFLEKANETDNEPNLHIDLGPTKLLTFFWPVYGDTNPL